MPFENPEPGRYWGYRCVKCHEAIAIWPFGEGSGWHGSGSFTLDCMNWAYLAKKNASPTNRNAHVLLGLFRLRILVFGFNQDR